MSTLTGDNPKLSVDLTLECFRRNRPFQQCWVDAGYNLDAPPLVAAGSMLRDEELTDPGDYIPLPSFAFRGQP